MVKKLLKESNEPAPTNGKAASTNGSAANGSAVAGYSRKNPYSAKMVESRELNAEGSAKDTRHVVIDLKGSGIKYEVGDALGIFPTNCEVLAGQVLESIGADANLKMDLPSGQSKPLRLTLCEDYCLKDPSDELLELAISRVEQGEALETLQMMLDEGVPEGFDVLDVLELADEVPISATAFIETLSPLNPRLYSIASSQKKVGDEVHLTVGKVAFGREGRLRKGVASTMLSERLTPGQTLRVFTQGNHGGFTVPTDPETPMIMVGPGTGIAPFVAFLQERDAAGSKGPNWLFFGDQHESTDFLYEQDLLAYQTSGLLNQLDTAFSRDGETKVYVQDRMRENAVELWQWLQDGAHFYVCGDASRMAMDVDRTLKSIVAEHGNMSKVEAESFVAQLTKDKRYVRDVY